MTDYLTPKTASLSALYVILAIVLLVLLDWGLYFFIRYPVVSILDWFNALGFAWKLFILFVGGGTLFSIFLGFTSRLSTLVGGSIFNTLPQNVFTIYSSFGLSVINTIYNLIWLWRFPKHYGFWIICELIMLSGFIWGLTSIIIPSKVQLEMRKESDGS